MTASGKMSPPEPEEMAAATEKPQAATEGAQSSWRKTWTDSWRKTFHTTGPGYHTHSTGYEGQNEEEKEEEEEEDICLSAFMPIETQSDIFTRQIC